MRRSLLFASMLLGASCGPMDAKELVKPGDDGTYRVETVAGTFQTSSEDAAVELARMLAGEPGTRILYAVGE